MAEARREYAHLIRMAFQESDRSLRITVPDRIRFPFINVYVHLRDAHTVVLSGRPSKNAVLLGWSRKPHLPGSRELRWPEAHIPGPYFRIMPVHYRVEGEDLVLEIPEEEHRHKPKTWNGRAGRVLDGGPHLPSVAAGPPPAKEPEPYTEPVRVIGYGNDFTYNVPMEVMVRLIDELARYRA